MILPAATRPPARKPRPAPNVIRPRSWALLAGQKDWVSFTREPERSLLTEPPPGYRTPSPNAPYGVVEEKSKYGKTSVMDRLDDPNAKK